MVVAFQLALPSALAPEYEGAGLGQTWLKMRDTFQATIVQQLGFTTWSSAARLCFGVVVLAGVVIGVPVGDVAALHAAIERVLGDPQLAEELAERGYRYVIEHHTTEQFVHTMVQGMRGLGEGVTSR